MSILSAPHFHNEEAAYAYVEARLWPEGPVCPHCGGVERISKMGGKSTRIGAYKCYQCRKPFTVKIGTIFEASHVPMRHWLQAMFLMAASKKGISANQIHRTLGCTLKTAWFICHRLREAMKVDGSEPMGGAGITLEVDETFLGQQATVFVSGKGWQGRRGTGDMQKIVTLVERGGRARSIKVETLQKDEIIRAMASAARESALMTDQAQHYRRIGKEFASHDAVDHGAGEYGRREGDTVITTNTVEGFFSIFKRGMKGVYQHCDEKHLHRYLAEFDFRYSNRIALGVDDVARSDRVLAAVVGKRLTYRPTRGGKASNQASATA
jgi:transposase-like protein